MDERKRLGLMLVLLGVLAVVAVVVFANQNQPHRPPPSGPGYYTGPMVNKSRTLVTTDDNKIVDRYKGDSGPGAKPGEQPESASGGQDKE